MLDKQNTGYCLFLKMSINKKLVALAVLNMNNITHRIHKIKQKTYIITELELVLMENMHYKFQKAQ